MTYGEGHTVLLRDPYPHGSYLYGVACDERGIADRTDCRDQEFAIRTERITATERGCG